MPDEPVILDELGQALVLTDRPSEAIEVYDRLIELQPRNDTAANNFAALVSDHAHDDAAMLERALAVAERFRGSDNGLFLDTLGWLYYRDGRYPTASTYLGRAVAAVPDRPDLRYHLGMALKETGDVERAIVELSRAVEAEVDFAGLAEAEETLAALEAEAAASAAAAGG